MTIVCVVPLLAYAAYRALIKSDDEDKKGNTVYLAVAAYVAYIVAESLMLSFSRTREYAADRMRPAWPVPPQFARHGTHEDPPTAARQRTRRPRTAVSMAIASGGTRGTLDTGSVRNAIQWDLRNPLAGWHELHSTHPPVARRIDHLGDLVASLGQAPLVVFDRQQPESYWDEFLVDLFCWRLPMPGIVFTVCAGIAFTGGAASEGGLVSAVPLAESWAVLSGGLIAWGVGRLLQHRFRYLCGSFPNLPGIMFLDDRQPMAIWEMLFGFMRAAGIPRGGVGKGAVPPAAAAAVARDGPRDLPGGFAPRRPGTTSCSSARHPACWWRSWRS